MWLGKLLKKRLPEPRNNLNHLRQAPKLFSLETLLEVVRPLPGEWESVFKGQGQNFARFREFRPPDSPLLIHLPTLAVTDETYITERIPRRGIETTIILDFSSSCDMEPAAAIRDTAAFLLAAGAIEKESPLAFIGFSEKVECLFPFDEPRTQLRRFQYWLKERFHQKQAGSKKTAFKALLPYICNRIPEKSLVFFISDFLEGEGMNEVFESMKGRIDCTPVVVDIAKSWDELPPAFYEVMAVDAEKGEQIPFLLTPDKIREIRQLHQERKEKLSLFFRRCGFYHAVLDTPDIKSSAIALTRCFRRKVQHRQR